MPICCVVVVWLCGGVVGCGDEQWSTDIREQWLVGVAIDDCITVVGAC